MSATFGVIAAEEVSHMASELARYGLQLPAFSKIGGILASELSGDEASGRGGLPPGALRRSPRPLTHWQGVRPPPTGQAWPLRASGAESRLADLVPCPLPVHAAVLAINEAVERGVAEDTLAALQNPSALLGDVHGPLAAIYQELLAQAKREKAANAGSRVRRRLGVHGRESWRPGSPGETEMPRDAALPVSGLRRRSQEPAVSYEKWGVT